MSSYNYKFLHIDDLKFHRIRILQFVMHNLIKGLKIYYVFSCQVSMRNMMHNLEVPTSQTEGWGKAKMTLRYLCEENIS